MDELFEAIPREEIDLDLKPDMKGVEDELEARWVLDSSAAAPAPVTAVQAVGTVERAG